MMPDSGHSDKEKHGKRAIRRSLWISAPANGGHVNLSPKSAGSFRVLGPRSVGYLDHNGSGVETIAHLRENGRVVFTFCAFAGPPKIVRLHGTGEIITPPTPEFAALRPLWAVVSSEP